MCNWYLVKSTHTDETNQLHGKILAYTGIWAEGEEKAYEAMAAIMDEIGASHDDEIDHGFHVIRSFNDLAPGSETKICF